MWEHRSVSNKAYIETNQMRPSETYVRLMDVVEEAVSKAQVDQFDHEAFLKYVPERAHGKNCQHPILQNPTLGFDISGQQEHDFSIPT